MSSVSRLFIYHSVAMISLFLVPAYVVSPVNALDFVKITSASVNIRASANEASKVITKASMDDVFELIHEEGEWFAIEMFSGIPRFVHSNYAQKLDFQIDLTIKPDEHAAIVTLIKSTREKARKEADTTFPIKKGEEYGRSEQFDRNTELLNELLDRYLLEALHKKSIQPPLYWYFIVENEISEQEKTPAPN